MSSHVTSAAKLLAARGHYVDILNTLTVSLTTDIDSRLILAEALIFSGDVHRGIALATELNADSASLAVRAKCERLLGNAARRLSNSKEAVHRFRSSARLAKQAGSIEDLAWASVFLFRALWDTEHTTALTAVLADARAAVTRAAQPHATVFLHESVARIEAQLGRYAEAERHLTIAESLLSRHPNAWLEFVTVISRFCVSSLTCDYEQSARWLSKGRELERITGAAGTGRVLDINECYYLLHTGAFEKARARLTILLQTEQGLFRVALLETFGRLALVSGELDECERLLSEAERIDEGFRFSFASRWSLLLRTLLFLKTGDAPAAVQTAADALEMARSLRDDALTGALTLTLAESLLAQGNVDRGIDVLIDAARHGIPVIRDLQGDYHRVWALALREISQYVAAHLNARARTIWTVRQDAYALALNSASETPKLRRALVGDAGTLVLNAAASAFDFAGDAVLVGEEIARVVGLLGCADRCEVFPENSREIRRDRSANAPDAVHLSVSTDYVLRVVPKPEARARLALADLTRLVSAIQMIAVARRQENARAALWPATDMEDTDGLFVCEETRALLATSRKIAPTTVPVLITGETGTGKEVLARAIHAASTRAGAVFLPFNCAAGPRDMIDAQLFGHRRGAFTGATEHAPGVFRAAAGGTLFLDEIGEAPIDVQPKLLRVLESGEIHPIGEPQPLRVDVRVIAATNADLDAMVAAGRLREDLFYRLNIVRLHLPPLRERRVEIPVFAHHYLSRYARDLGKGDLRLAEESMEYLLLYKWPGNVRQLANEMRRLAALAETDAVLMPEHLSPEIVAARRTIPASERTLDANEVVVRLDQPLAAAAEHLERALLQYALKACGGRMEDTARRLGLSRKGLYLKRQRFGLEPPGAHARTA